MREESFGGRQSCRSRRRPEPPQAPSPKSPQQLPAGLPGDSAQTPAARLGLSPDLGSPLLPVLSLQPGPGGAPSHSPAPPRAVPGAPSPVSPLPPRSPHTYRRPRGCSCGRGAAPGPACSRRRAGAGAGAAPPHTGGLRAAAPPSASPAPPRCPRGPLGCLRVPARP